MVQHAGIGDRLWSIILAGGEGKRLRSFVYRWLGFHKPKQYCSFVGKRSMFQHTLDRVATLTPPDRSVAVVAREHRREALSQFDGRSVGTVLLQPKNCDTAAGIFLPLTYIAKRDPLATVVLFPSDHFVFPENSFIEVVQRAVWTAESLQDRLVLLGVEPDRLELEYGWIEPERHQAQLGDQPVRVRRFIEKPTTTQADAALKAGALWNTLVLAAKAETLWKLGWQCFPVMMPLFERLGQAIGTSEEVKVLSAIYRDMPAKSFSTHLLQQVPEQVMTIKLNGVLWSDWGKAERITETLRRIDRKPAFPLECLERPFAPIPLM